jgi:hypothetical protein
MPDKVIVQFGDHAVRGYVDKEEWPPEKDLGADPFTMPIRTEETEAGKEISLIGAKSVFFVKTFTGKQHEDLRFHDDVPPVDCLWVRVVFRDGEVIEGLVRNSCYFVSRPGFFMIPTDPEGNNWLIYVIKDSLKDLRILGLRPVSDTVLHLDRLS